jgi:hypothetical protein
MKTDAPYRLEEIYEEQKRRELWDSQKKTSAKAIVRKKSVVKKKRAAMKRAPAIM